MTTLAFMRENAEPEQFRRFIQTVRQSIVQVAQLIENTVQASNVGELDPHLHTLKNEFAHLGYTEGVDWSGSAKGLTYQWNKEDRLTALHSHVGNALRIIDSSNPD